MIVWCLQRQWSHIFYLLKWVEVCIFFIIYNAYINIIGVPHEILLQRNIPTTKQYVLNAQKGNLQMEV